MYGVLYVIATPIGNMDDITIRALSILSSVDYIAAEDTRKTGNLLVHHKISHCKLISYNEYNEDRRGLELIDKLKEGKSIALVSNAGTPLISDPGYSLIKISIENNVKIIPIPGPSALITSLSASGMPTDSFIFIGFLPKKETKRIELLKKLSKEERTLIFYESPKRILSLLEEIIKIMGDRYGVLARELTKIHEEFLRGMLSSIIRDIKNRPSVKGECTLIIKYDETIKEEITVEALRSEIYEALKNSKNKLSIISKDIAKKYGISKDEVYEEALKIKANLPFEELSLYDSVDKA
ncbi:MAG: 16S rRNA (cytidine(1402)-2'-O)-methyltransferase [Desulfobacterales bacterium]|nr:16S rRNA (cytidine(1402)-2'-O)-methyltransferase [Desulfobacterales bacterium]